MLDLKYQQDNIDIHPRMACNPISIAKSDRYLRYRLLRTCKDLMPVISLFEGRIVYDVGIGFGIGYHPIRFGRPSKIIAIEPSLKNLETCGGYLGYDELHPSTWQDHQFLKGSVVFLRRNWLPDYAAFLDKMVARGVVDIVVVDHFLDLGEDQPTSIDVFTREEFDFDTCNRWAYNQSISHRMIPSIGSLSKMCDDRGYYIQRKYRTNKVGLIVEHVIHMVKKKDVAA